MGVTILGTDPELVGRLEEALAADGDPGRRARLLARLAIERAYEPDPAHRTGPVARRSRWRAGSRRRVRWRRP